jgi:anionic cell wall polymer biosynthesis LytR-Cps2A-Psr (LCP) family protein
VKKRLKLLHPSKRDASILFLAFITVLAGVGIFFIAMMINYDPIEEALAADQVVNTLFVLENDTGKPLSSFVLMYYPATRRAAVFDIPGEVGLILQGVNRVDRIDTVYDPQKASVFTAEIAAFLGVDINFSVIFNLTTLVKTVDLIEGVELFIPSPVEQYDSVPPVLFASGLRRLDGDKVRSYLMYTVPDEDSDSVRLRRQRFFYAFIRRLNEQNETLKQKSVARIYQTFLKASMKERERIRLFDEYAKINMDRVSIQSVSGTIREVSGQTLLLPSYNGNLIKDVVRQTLGGLTRQLENSLSDRVYTVEVLNGTATNGLASRTAELLRGFGYDVISIGNTEQSQEDTLIIDRSGLSGIVQYFGDIIRCTNFQKEAPDSELGGLDTLNLQNLNYKADFILIIGRDFDGRYVTNR